MKELNQCVHIYFQCHRQRLVSHATSPSIFPLYSVICSHNLLKVSSLKNSLPSHESYPVTDILLYLMFWMPFILYLVLPQFPMWLNKGVKALWLLYLETTQVKASVLTIALECPFQICLSFRTLQRQSIVALA